MDFNDQIRNQISEGREVVERPVRDVEDEIYDIGGTQDIAVSRQEDILRAQESKQTLDAQRQEFDEFADDNPDLLITQDDGSQITMRQLQKELADDEKFLNEVNVCAVG